MDKMSDISEAEWKKALISILEELDDKQYHKMLEFLPKIRKSKKNGRYKEKMPQKIIECYGLEESISAISEAMEELPRRDAAVQDLLRPFVDKLRNKQEKENMGKRKVGPVEEDGGPAAAKKRKCDPLKERRPAAEQQKSGPPDEGRKTHPWKKSISDLKSSSDLKDTDGIIGKVVQKSGLRTYKTKEKVKKFFFYVAVADQTASIKLMVYGKDQYQQFQEEKCYLFRKLIRGDICVKVTKHSIVSETSSVQVPEEFKMEARTLIYPESPVCTIAEAKLSADGMKTVEGTITEIDPVKKVKVQQEQRKTEQQNFQLRDETDSTRICMWAENTKQCKGLSVGDVVKVTKLRTNEYHGTTSLSSTARTQILKVQGVGIQNVTIEIIGIRKAIIKETHLEAEINGQVHTFVVNSRLLAEAFGLKLDGDFKQSLLDVMPLSAEAVIKGNRIKKFTAHSKI